MSPAAHALWGTVIRPPILIEPFTLTDQRGRPFRFPRDTGRVDVILLYFGYTHCPDICPDTMAEIAVALRQVPPAVAERVAVVFVTVDPERDDPARLRAWVGLFGRDFTGLTGRATRIASIMRTLGYERGPITDVGGGAYVVGHPTEYLAVAPDGTVRVAYPWGITVPQLQEDLIRLVEEGWVR
jgi:protein SCO1/2